MSDRNFKKASYRAIRYTGSKFKWRLEGIRELAMGISGRKVFQVEGIRARGPGTGACMSCMRTREEASMWEQREHGDSD